jgi:Protein of unknown function (DUF1427)
MKLLFCLRPIVGAVGKLRDLGEEVLDGLADGRAGHLPSPSVVALIGLFGMLMGEQIPPLIRHILAKTPASVAWIEQVRPHMFGHLPAGRKTPGNRL